MALLVSQAPASLLALLMTSVSFFLFSFITFTLCLTVDGWKALMGFVLDLQYQCASLPSPS